jgi:hypothetical protein
VEEVAAVARIQANASVEMVESSQRLAALSEALRGVLRGFRTTGDSAS